MAAIDVKTSHRILILTPFGKDAEHLCRTLEAQEFNCFVCKDIKVLAEEISRGVGMILTTEEALLSKEANLVVSVLKNQPSWSAIPVLVFYTPTNFENSIRQKLSEPLSEFTDVTFLQRPVSTVILINSVKGAHRDRKRQYLMHGLLEELQEDINNHQVTKKELEKAKAQLEQALSTARNASESKSQFLANMSHEIRTPLGAIMGFAELISKPGLPENELDHFVSIIKRNSSQLLTIIDDILDLSKVEAGKMEIERSRFSLRDMLSDFNSILFLKAHEKGIGFEMTLAENVPLEVISDSTRLRQILMNIVGNAIKFTEKGKVHLNVTFSNDLLSFEVTDTGRGISGEQAKILFEPFVQADSSTTRKFGGTGLGLVLTRRLSEAMGGTFVLKKSRLNEGSVFEAHIRVERAGSTRFSTFRPSLNSFGLNSRMKQLEGMKVLLVEDSLDNQYLIKTFLNNFGAQTDVASDGVEGVEKALRGKYSAILMDVQMPRMDGLEAVQSLRQQGLTTPIIALTAHAMKEEETRCLAAGFSYFLSKPLKSEALNFLLHKIHISKDLRH